MRINKSIFVVVIFSLLFIYSCEGGIEPGEVQSTGFDGVNMRFADYPTNEIYKGDQFSFNVELNNEGFYTSQKTLLVIKDPPTTYFERKGGNAVNIVQDFPGQNQIPQGSFRGPYYNNYLVKLIPGGLSRQPIPFAATLCYDYETEASLLLCVGKSENEEQCKKEVESDNLKILSNGQGSPIAVTSLEYSLNPVEDGTKHIARIIFTLENKGRGIPYKNQGSAAGDSVDIACSALPGKDLINTVDYEINLGTDSRYSSLTGKAEGLNCNPQKLRFDDKTKSAKITCIQDSNKGFPAGNTVKFGAHISLDYVYQEGQSISFNFRDPDIS